MPNTSERTFIIIKPDGVQRNFIGKIVQRFEERGYKLVGMKLVCASKDHWEFHYQDLKVLVNKLSYILPLPPYYILLYAFLNVNKFSFCIEKYF